MLLEGQGFTQAVFEAVSGWTTTGLSIVDVTGASHPLLLWRSIMQLAGGAGLALITMASIAGPLGPGLSAAEGRAQQLVPHVRRSAAVLLRIYSLYVAAGVLALWAAGMSLFDAVNHAFCAVSTGGFSTQPESIGHWQSPAIEIVTVILMVLGSINYRTAYLVMQGRGAALLRNGEVRLALVLLAASALLVGLLVVPETGVAGGRALRIAVFETASATTTAGFSTTSYANWPAIGVFALILLMLIGGGTSSTAGGMKQYRAYLLLKAAAWELRGALLPRSVVTADYIWDGEQKQYVNDAHIKQAATFGVLYFGTYILGVLLLVGHGYPLQDAMFEYASCVGTVGLSVGVTSPETPGAVTWVQTAGMFLGRLEFSIIIVSVLKLIGDARQLAAGNRG